MINFSENIKSELLAAAAVFTKASDQLLEQINMAANILVEAYKKNNTCYFFGNGGSAADSQHLATELVCRFKKNRRALPALALTTDTSFLTAASNDFSFDSIFERQIEAFCKKGDVAIGISTSGNSKNVELGLIKAKELGATTIAFLGKDGGTIKNVVDIAIIIPSENTPHIQECHIAIGHILCDIVEKEMFE